MVYRSQMQLSSLESVNVSHSSAYFNGANNTKLVASWNGIHKYLYSNGHHLLVLYCYQMKQNNFYFMSKQ